jgi:copper resistance protein B
MKAGAKDCSSDRSSTLISRVVIAMIMSVTAYCFAIDARAQATEAPASMSASPTLTGWKPPVTNEVIAHILFNELEGPTSGSDNEFRWDGEGWIGTDMNRLWIKSEGVFEDGSMSDGDQELLYDRPIPRLRYFDAQVGIREDLDSGPSRTWGAVGIEGLAPNFFQLEPTFYFRDGGHVAGRIASSYDLKITQRLIAQPQLEMNFYSSPDPARGLGTGLTDLDTGLRLRYEFSRKLAPYVGFAYTNQFGSTAAYSRQAGGSVSNPRFIFGLRVWY